MKKSVIALILIAVLIIIVSPGLVGKLAEESVGDNLNWAAEESGELVVRSDGFDRGWFSSEGQHRIELGEGQIRAALTADGADDIIPALLINTHIDHGLIPVSSMGRDEGSLAPRLGSAVSTLAIDSGGEITDLPGTIYSNVGLGGDLDSRYVLEAGSHTADDGEVTWEPTTINVLSSAGSGNVEFSGDVGAMTFGDDQQVVTVEGITFSGNQETTRYGFTVGDVNIDVGDIAVNAGGMAAGGLKNLTVKATSSVDDGEVNAAMHLDAGSHALPGFGEVAFVTDMKLNFQDAETVGRVSQRLDELQGSSDPTQIMSAAQEELKDLFASGFSVNFDQFNVSLPMGLVESKMSFEFPADDRANFEWTSLLMNAVADVDLQVPEALVQFATSMNPEVGGIVAMGILKKEGEVYVLDAEFRQGLLKVNGAPIPIPLGAFQ